jgi:hypothetical protein
MGELPSYTKLPVKKAFSARLIHWSPPWLARHGGWILSLLMLPHLFWSTRGAWNARLQPDVETYLAILDTMKHPWDTVPRESVFMWWVWLVKLFVPTAELAPRIAGLLVYFVTAYFLFLLGRDRFKSLLAGLLAQFVFLHSHMQIDLAVNGLRDNYFTLGLATFAYFFHAPSHVPAAERAQTLKRNALGVTLSFALIVGTRITALASLSLWLFAWTAFYLPGSWKTRLFSGLKLALPGWLVIAPFIYTCYQVSGDPMYAANVHASWWRNYEFVTLKKTGCDSCATPEQVKETHYAGEPITITKYMFGLHTPTELAVETTRGLIKLFAWPSSLFVDLTSLARWYYFWVVLGVLTALASGGLYYGVLIAYSVNLLAYTLSIGMPHRLFSQVTLFHALAIGLGLSAAFAWVAELVRLKRHRSSEATP